MNRTVVFHRLRVAIAAGVVSAGLLMAQSTAAQDQGNIALNPDHPDRYVVQPGDTLWDISARFLRDPWYWPEIWQVNPQIENPHLIYPGDVLSLVYVNGQPRLVLQRGQEVVHLSPKVREEPIQQAINTIPYATIHAFLAQAAVLTRDEAEQLPYVVAMEGRKMIAGAGDRVYVRGLDETTGTDRRIVHVGDPLRDPETQDVLGYEALAVGEGTVSRSGDPATFAVTNSNREALIGDRLMPPEQDIPLNFEPRSPDRPVAGQIISVVDGISLIGPYQVVVLNRGARDGLEPGHVLRSFTAGEVVRDTVSSKGFLGGEKVQLPDEPSGVIMVFKTFDRLSYALVMSATSEIRVLDAVRNP